MLFKGNPIIRLKCVLMAARLYVVEGCPGHYYCDGQFYRRHSGVWESTRDWNGRWRKARRELLPAVLIGAEPPRPAAATMAGAPVAPRPHAVMMRLRTPHTSAS